MSKSIKVSIEHQSGKVSLQSLFWIVGIIVGLLTILQIVLSFPNIADDSIANDSEAANAVENPSESSETHQSAAKEPVKPIPSALETPFIKIDKYKAYDNGIAVDNALGLIWMRCSLGQEWDGSRCEGSAKAYTKEEAQQAIDQLNKVSYVGLYDWKLPDIEAMHSLLECNDGYEGSYVIPVSSGSEKTVAVDCAGDFKVPAINEQVFPDTQWAIWRGYWTSSSNKEGEPLAIYFNDGKIKAKDKAHYVRPVRSLNP